MQRKLLKLYSEWSSLNTYDPSITTYNGYNLVSTAPSNVYVTGSTPIATFSNPQTSSLDVTMSCFDPKILKSFNVPAGSKISTEIPQCQGSTFNLNVNSTTYYRDKNKPFSYINQFNYGGSGSTVGGRGG